VGVGSGQQPLVLLQSSALLITITITIINIIVVVVPLLSKLSGGQPPSLPSLEMEHGGWWVAGRVTDLMPQCSMRCQISTDSGQNCWIKAGQ